ncbi:hypothetical protein HDU87_000469 [Geranomyces variabilis]|uniref:Galactose oxidase n=1 Tax=Geranomyces variabilis TaxID=109894 RepID=A0AAD5TES4_9FUNG|nr:hypothetical protein HDU87_000469 [Geranomyces variabilis]
MGTAQSCPGNYVAIAGFDIPSIALDLPNNAHILGSACECAALCAQTQNCDFYSYGPDVRTCWLKTTIKTDPARFTRFIGSSHAVFGDIPGGDMPNMPTQQPDGEACLASCVSTTGCQWTNYLINPNGGVTCWLKQLVANPNRQVGYFASVMVCPTGTGSESMIRMNFDLPGFDLANSPFTNTCDCSNSCRNNPDCDFWNVNGGRCWLKATAKKPDFYTWFLGASGSIDGDIPNFDLNAGGAPVPAATPQMCLALCAKNSACQWINYRIINNNGVSTVDCWLKTGQAVQGASIGALSSAAHVQRACDGQGAYRMQYGLDIPNFDLAAFANFASACECADACEASDNCDFFIWGDNTCWLKTTVKKPGYYTWFKSAIGAIPGDIPNFDLAGPSNLASATACMTTCGANDNCDWANILQNPDGSVTCWLKTAQRMNNRAVGFAAAGASGVVQNADIPNFDLAGPYPTVNFRACSRLCSGTPNCAWADFVQGTGCYLKTPQPVAGALTWFKGSLSPFAGDVPQFDLEGPYNEQTVYSCYARCLANANCMWINTVANGGNQNCWLKTGTPGNGKSIIFPLGNPSGVGGTGTIQGPPPNIGGQFNIPAVCTDAATNPERRFCTGSVGIHAIVTAAGPLGSILYMERGHVNGDRPLQNIYTLVNGSPHPYGEVASLYDIASGRFQPIRMDDHPFCAGHHSLPNGNALIIGGDNPIPKTNPQGQFQIADGTARLREFNPWTKQWVRTGNMRQGRWYPTVVQLPDDRFMIWGGITTDNNGVAVNSWEILDSTLAGNNLQTTVPVDSPLLMATANGGGGNGPNGAGQPNLYPFIHVLTDGNLFVFAREQGVIFSPQSMSEIRKLPNTPGGAWHSYPMTGSSVLLPLRPDATGNYPRSEVVIVGGATQNGGNDAGLYRLDMSNPVQWQVEQMPSMRCMGDSVLLPNGQIFIVNGAVAGIAGGPAGTSSNRTPNFQSVLYSPDAAPGNRFQQAAVSTIRRLYHSTAFLLPDGTVMISGSDQQTGANDAGTQFEYQAEIYTPPYLHNGSARPAITAAPGVVNLNQQFTISYTGSVNEVTLMKTPSVTHQNDMSQRSVVLRIIRNGNAQVTVAMPSSYNVITRGDYYLFVLGNGTPSIARFVRLQ